MRRKKRNQKKHLGLKILDLIFVLIFLIIIFSFTVGIIIRGQHDVSIAENRNLTKFERFSISKFIDRSFQNNIETALSDQMVLGQTIKYKLNTQSAKLTNILQKSSKNILAKNFKEYIPISNDIYYFADSNYMLKKCQVLNNDKNIIDYISNQYNNYFKNIDSYMYMVTTSSMIDFNNTQNSQNEYHDYIRSDFNHFKYDYLKINSFSEYENYFYETDHHWNYKGSYQGYKDIISLLGVTDNPIEPTFSKTYDFNFYGSFARLTSVYDNQEKFTVYKYNIPEHSVYINGAKEKGQYGNKDEYDKGIYNNSISTNHYAEYYGLDHGLVKYDFNQPDKENLLVISPSYSNSIKELIASHFNKTYFVDLRHYKRSIGEDFVPEEFIKNNDIDKFLFITSITNLTDGKFSIDDQKEGLQDGF